MRIADQKVAIVTGAGSGIGKALATRLATENWLVACCDVNLPSVETLARSLGPNATFFFVDIADYTSQANIFKADRSSIYMLDRRGRNVCDVPGRPELRSLRATYEGFLFGVQLAVHYMRGNDTPGGMIVATSSIAAVHPHQTFPEYCGGKAAKDNITLNAILPGIVVTGAVPQASIDATKPEHLTPVETVVEAYMLCLNDREINGELIECSTDKRFFLPAPELANGEATKRACTVWEPLFEIKHGEKSELSGAIP
ncbi:hypothetical protein BJY04DRAFT_209619 [Aspergillus karnatakaensis]|uniref:uncharacterized protein n=1 Tax=Aspergillus karnatakaensis TaxID=1810916 RepID=UPI003CCCBFFB